MPKGGARVRSGPAPDAEALRRDRPLDAAGWLSLPAEGRQGPVPVWPLADPLDREIDLWEDEWCRPQALLWDRNNQELEVALYVRAMVTAESPDAPVAARNLVRLMRADLYLTLDSLAKARIRIEASPPDGRRAVPRPVAKGSVRARLKVVTSGEEDDD